MDAPTATEEGMGSGVGEPTVNLGVLEHPGGDLVVEEQVDLAEGEVFGLGKPVPAPDIAQ